MATYIIKNNGTKLMNKRIYCSRFHNNVLRKKVSDHLFIPKIVIKTMALYQEHGGSNMIKSLCLGTCNTVTLRFVTCLTNKCLSAEQSDVHQKQTNTSLASSNALSTKSILGCNIERTMMAHSYWWITVRPPIL